ncbi:MAG: periplasmic heavy metal sensor [Ignavibacteriae bacterium]|nr:periplasmic heavy metal sensor [Ignavibacteriota bacterium]
MKHNILGGLCLVFILSSALAIAQTVPSDREALETGAGAGMAKYADMNGYPGPKHILDMRDTLKITSQQGEKIQALFDEMKKNAIAKGKQIIAQEERLDALFRGGSATTSQVNSLSREIGKLRGELRAVHLTAHIAAKKILTKEQTALYNSLRHGSPKMHEGH